VCKPRGDLQRQLETYERKLNEAREHLAEALEQQAATSEILRVISSSPTELQRVLDAVGENAARLCDANNAVIFRLEGDLLRQVASYGGLPTTSHPAEGLPVNSGRVTGRAVFERRTIHVHDLAAEEDDFPEGSRDARRDGHRTTLATPLLREGVPIGAILIRRMEVRPFSEKQIALLGTFADQAAIAIENARLFEAERQHTRELSEALEQQTATSEVLRVISSSSGELAPVFESLLASAKHLCGAEFGIILLREGDAFRTVALHGATAEYTEARWRAPFFRPAADTGLGRVLETKQVGQIADVQEVAGYVDNPVQAPIVRLAGVRTKLTVPMLKEGDLIGVIEIDRQEVRPFTDKQIELVKNFAAQAVIAIENTRLLNELRKRTDDLTRHWSSRPRLPMCCRSSQARLASWSRCSKPCWRMPRASAGQRSASCSTTRTALFARRQNSTCQRLSPSSSGSGDHLSRRPEAHSSMSSARSNRSTSPMPRRKGSFFQQLGQAWRRAHLHGRADAQGARADRRNCHLSPGGTTFHRQAGRACQQFRETGRHRHREHTPAQRAAPAHRRSKRIAAAADRDRRRAQGDQPLNI
jgi:GAF domain-containing protein